MRTKVIAGLCFVAVLGASFFYMRYEIPNGGNLESLKDQLQKKERDPLAGGGEIETPDLSMVTRDQNSLVDFVLTPEEVRNGKPTDGKKPATPLGPFNNLFITNGEVETVIMDEVKKVNQSISEDEKQYLVTMKRPEILAALRSQNTALIGAMLDQYKEYKRFQSSGGSNKSGDFTPVPDDTSVDPSIDINIDTSIDPTVQYPDPNTGMLNPPPPPPPDIPIEGTTTSAP